MKSLTLLFIFAVNTIVWANNQIRSYYEFEQLSQEINGERFTKLLLDLQTETVDYFDVKNYPLHSDYVFKNYGLSYSEYIQNYEEVKPRFLFCTLIHNIQADIWTLTLWEGDKATAAHLNQCFKALSCSFYLADQVYFRPLSTLQEALLCPQIPFVTNDDLYRRKTYQLLNASTAVGTLRLNKQSDWQHDEIIVLSELIPDITPVAGIITEQFSTPLSHLALRARAWDIPHAGIKDATTLLQQFDGKRVFFKTTSSGYEIRLARNDDRVIKTQNPIHIPKADLSQQEIKPLHQLQRKDVTSYGTKAANLGEYAHYSIDGYAIPFYYYDKHLHDAGVDLEHDDPATIAEKICAFPLELEIPLLPAFVRSSTNAEDLPNFSGAGLYETVANVQDHKSLMEAIKTVWASVWQEKAYKERERTGIAHKDVFAGVLIQPALDATSAGVLVTKDIFDPAETMEVYTINASHGLGLAVVEGAMIPEQILYNLDNKGIKVLSRLTPGSITVCNPNGGTMQILNPHAGKAVLSDAEVITLGNRVRQIKRTFRTNLDIEWLFVNDKLYIMQIRPFT